MRAAPVCVAAALLAGAGAGELRAQGAYKDEPAQAAPAGAVPAAPAPFANGCALCHGKDAKGTAIGPGLANSAHVQALSDDDIANIIKKGKGKMPPFPLQAADVVTVTKYLRAINPPGSAAPAAAPAPASGGTQPQARMEMMPMEPGQRQGLGQAGEAPRAFAQTCSLCHGNDARGTDRAPTLVNPDHFKTLTDADLQTIIVKGKGKMPGFPVPSEQLIVLTSFIRGINSTASVTPVAGDAKAGEAVFFGGGACSLCHMVHGQGGSIGPDLSAVGRRLRLPDMQRALTDPAASIPVGYTTSTVALKSGKTLTGFLRAQGSHDLVLQTLDGKLHPLLDSEYKTVTPQKTAAMPPFAGTAEERQNVVAYLSTLTGAGVVGALTAAVPATPDAEIEKVVHPPKGDWPNYNGGLSGNRNSALDQINVGNVARLAPQFTYTNTYFGLETTPVVADGVMYVTGNNQVDAISAKTGRAIWHYERPKSVGSTISGDAAIGSNRGAAVMGDRVFYLTDNAHLIALNRVTGGLEWDVDTPEGAAGHFGGTAAPLVVGDLVVTGVSGGDNGIRGFVAAYKAETGEKVWKFMTIPTPEDTGPIADTWKGSALGLGGGATWTTGSASADGKIIYWPIGNPHPDTDGDERAGSNLYTDSDVALDAATGKLLWYFQYTPHDLHDWDANQPVVLVDATWKGQPRKLLLHANRNGFLYVLDRTDGKPLLATKMVDTLNWASGIDPQTFLPDLLPANETSLEGVVGCPAVRGATNWYSTAYSPATNLYYVMTVEDCTLYRKAEDGGYGRYLDPAHPAQKILRAFNIETGKVVWQISLPGPVQSNYAGVLSTAGGLLFFGESSGGFAAVDAKTGKYLWHYETNHAMKASPMTYEVDGKQYVAIASGPNVLSFALPDAAAAK
jgi:PQQ-dependent dehydrogenase (methanol/ethanol family)